MSQRRIASGSAPVFLTTVTAGRTRHFADHSNASRLLDVLRIARDKKSFAMVAYAILPDHVHLLIRPFDKYMYAEIIASIKANYSRLLAQAIGVNGSIMMWQRSFYDHIIRDESDYNHHIDYIHYNPVRHKYTDRPENWDFSSFLVWRERGRYAPMWGWSLPDSIRGMACIGDEGE